ncbi:MAG: hypothetical protein U0401_25335 [Anaerolineae bacterium]
MKIQFKIKSRLNFIVLSLLLLGILWIGVAQAAPPAQDPRPPVNTGDGAAGGGAGNNGGGNSSPELRCAKLSGQVTNWGVGPKADIGTELKTGSWQATSISSSDGTFGYGGLGVGLAILHVVMSPQDTLKPLIQDAGVYLSCDYPLVANIAVFSGEKIEPPATIEMSTSSQTINPGDDFSFTLTVKNNLPNEITNVIVTNMMPRGLKALQVSSSTRPKDAQIVDGGSDGQLVVVNLDKLAKGAKATITIKVNADIDLLGGTKIKNTATLFYRESFAHQASLDLTVSNGEEPIQAAAGGTAQTGADFVPPANAPTTGGDLLAEEDTSTNTDNIIPVSSSAKPNQESAAEFVAPGNMPSTGGDLLSTLPVEEPTIVVNPSQEITRVSSGETSTFHLSNIHASREPGVVRVVVDKTNPKASPITVMTGFLLLGLLALGSGVAILTRRTSVWSQGKE